VLAGEVSHGEGPVCVEISYRVGDGEGKEFLRIVYAVGLSRRRNGAQNWRLYRDLGETDHYVERFIVESWLDYLRQQERVTLADESLERSLSRFRFEPLAPRRYVYQPPAEVF